MPKTGQRAKSTDNAKASRKSKVTEEHTAEAQRLWRLWKAAENRPSQAKFGDDYEIGNQSAVGQFLRGEVPLSLNAARGFAIGLGCKLEDFSPRLAAEAARIASAAPSLLSPEVAAIAAELEKLEPSARATVLDALAEIMKLAKPRPASPSRGTAGNEDAARRGAKG